MFPKDKDAFNFCRLHREVPGVARAAGGTPQDPEGEIINNLGRALSCFALSDFPGMRVCLVLYM